jgi:hypothetical protein
MMLKTLRNLSQKNVVRPSVASFASDRKSRKYEFQQAEKVDNK